MNHQMDHYREQYSNQLKQHFGQDQRRIAHAFKVCAVAERIMDGEGVNDTLRKIITITALLHDVGIKIAEEKYQSSAGPYQEIEGPPIVRAIMEQCQETKELIERVVYIVGGHHTATKNDGLDFQIIWEADLFVNIEEDNIHTNNNQKMQELIAKNFRTPTGIQIAKQQYLML